MSDSATRANALDHVVVVLFENRSFDNVLGRLYGPEDGKNDPDVELTGELIIEVLRDVSWHLFAGLAPDDEGDGH